MSGTESATFTEHVFRAQDDVAIHYRAYGDKRASGVPALCLTGLTRNARDFHALAQRMAPYRRVFCMDYRGRGKSAWASDYRSYQPSTYVGDALALLAIEGVHRVVLIGTSLGGLVSMGLSVAAPAMVAGVVLNDIGPEIATEGRARIAEYVGQPLFFANHTEAGRALMAQFGKVAPEKGLDFWTDQAVTMFVPDETRPGQLRLNYDLNLGRALKEQASQPIPDLWPLYGALARIPLLAVRGALSDVLSAETFARMKERKPDMMPVLLANRGHVPILDEPEFLAPFDRFISAF